MRGLRKLCLQLHPAWSEIPVEILHRKLLAVAFHSLDHVKQALLLLDALLKLKRLQPAALLFLFICLLVYF